MDGDKGRRSGGWHTGRTPPPRRSDKGTGPDVSDGTSKRSTGQKIIYTVKGYKRTREEALSPYLVKVPQYEMFDLETGHMKEEYKRRRSPSPPDGTTVYEVGSGRPYRYTLGLDLGRINPGSDAMMRLRKKAKEIGVLPANLPIYENTDSKTSRWVNYSTKSTTDTPVTDTPTCPSSSQTLPDPASVDLAAPGVSGLRRITQLALDLPRFPQTSGRTSGPKTSSAQSMLCDCVALVGIYRMELNVKMPELTNAIDEELLAEGGNEAAKLLSKSATLRLLRDGYNNFKVEPSTVELHTLRSFVSPSPKLKQFKAYKTITSQKVSHDIVRSEQEPGTQTEHRLYRMTMLINHYINVFSALGDFNYSWMTPEMKGGISNVLVVDKVWAYSPTRGLYVPRYSLLAGDEYTNLSMREVTKLENMGTRLKYIRFVSTPTTVLITSGQALIRDDAASEPSEAVTQQPPKKRRTTSSSPPLLLRDVSYGRFTYRLCSEDLASSEHPNHFTEEKPNVESRQNLDQVLAKDITSAPIAAPVRNPTLVVFRHNMDAVEPDTLICVIAFEIQLTTSVKY